MAEEPNNCKPSRNGADVVNIDASESDPCMTGKRGTKGGRWEPIEQMLITKTGLHQKALYVMGALLLVLLLLFVVVVVLAASWPRLPHHHSFPVCMEPSCLRAAAQIRESLNSSVSPCSDLWRWACGGWLFNHELPAGRSIWNQRHQLMREEAIQIRELITTLLSLSRETIEGKMKQLYENCMDVNNIDYTDQDRQLKRLISALGGWYILRDWVRVDFDARKVMTELHVKYGVSTFVQVSVKPNPLQPGNSSISIGPAELGLPAKSFYYTAPDNKIQLAYKELIRDTVIQLGATNIDAEKFSNDIFYYEKRIAEILPDVFTLQNPINTSKFRRLWELKETVNTLPLYDILTTMYPESKVTEETEVLVSSLDYLYGISQIVATTDSTTMNGYLIWTLVRKYLPYLPTKFTSSLHAFEEKLKGYDKPSPRWEKCINMVKDIMGIAVDVMLENVHPLKADTKKTVKDVFETVKKIVDKKLNKYKNLPDLYRHLKNKLSTLNLQIGLPNKIKDEEYLKSVYADLYVAKSSLFDSYRDGVQFLKRLEERQLSRTKLGDASLSEVKNNPSEVQYLPFSNKVVIPRLMLTKPFFENKYPKPVIYGRLGIDIAQAIVASVLPFDSFWTSEMKLLSPFHMIVNDSLRMIEYKEECYNDLLDSSFTNGTTDTHSNIIFTLVKDLTALQVAQEAFESTLREEEHTHQPTLETFEDQALFFLSYSQERCTIVTKQQVLYDSVVHSKISQQTLLELSFGQVPAFKKALGCTPLEFRCDAIL